MALADLMTKEVIKVPLESKGKFDIITELINIIDEAGYLKDKNAALEAVISRENQGSTGLAEGIAVPHAKTDAVSHVVVALGISPEGIDFEAVDGKPSHLFFLMLAPPSQAGRHVEILAEIARLCKSPGVLKELKNASTAEDAIEVFG